MVWVGGSRSRLKYFLLIFYISGHYCTLADREHGSSFYQDKCSDQQLKTLTQNYLRYAVFENAFTGFLLFLHVYYLVAGSFKQILTRRMITVNL